MASKALFFAAKKSTACFGTNRRHRDDFPSSRGGMPGSPRPLPPQCIRPEMRSVHRAGGRPTAGLLLFFFFFLLLSKRAVIDD